MADPRFVGIAYKKIHFTLEGNSKALCGKDTLDLPQGITVIPAHQLTSKIFEIQRNLPSRYCQVCNDRAAHLAGLLPK